MKIFLIQAIGEIEWGEFDEAVVIATDALYAEKLIRVKLGARKAKLKVTEIVPDKEQILMYSTGEENFTKKRDH